MASISHELRTPLTSVVGYAELLRDDSVLSPGERDEMISAIVEQSNDLANIVEDLLIAARIDTDSLVAVEVPVDLRAQAAQVLESLASATDSALITLNGHPTRPVGVGDPARVRQILRNLVTNALRYGGPNIEISVTNGDSSVRIAVADDGPGVSPDLSARIFEPYQQGHVRAGLTASIGLGLTVSRELARLMNGDLTYHRHEGHSIFELALPAATPTPSEDPATPTQPQQPSHT